MVSLDDAATEDVDEVADGRSERTDQVGVARRAQMLAVSVCWDDGDVGGCEL